MLNTDQIIRERAYHLWMQEGCPEGRADYHWHLAHQEVLSSLSRPAAPERRKRVPAAKRAAVTPALAVGRRTKANA